MKRVGLGILSLLLMVSTAMGQQTQEQLQQAYDEALVQLKAAQDRKNELALENQKLQKRIAELEQQYQTTQERLETLENRAYFLREHYAAWHDFVQLNPPIGLMWTNFFNSIVTPANLTDILGDGNWPFSVVDQPVE